MTPSSRQPQAILSASGRDSGGDRERVSRPAAMLLHPLYLASLALLIANDHWAKTADFLPAALTGKISDVVGPVVAGGLLAVLVGARSRGSIAACFAAAAVGVAALNVVPGVAAWVEAMSATMASFGIGWAWRVTVDATDLFSLLPLPLLVIPLLRRAEAGAGAGAGAAGEALGAVTRDFAVSAGLPPAARCGKRMREAALIIGAALASAATSQTPEPPSIRDEFALGWDAHLVLGNATADDVHVRIRRLRATVTLDCAAIAELPSESLNRELFGDGRTFRLVAGRTMPLGATLLPALLGLEAKFFAVRGECDALLIEGAGLGERLVFYRNETYPMIGVDQRVSVAKAERLVAFEADPSNKTSTKLRWRSHDALFSAPATQSSQPALGCALRDDATVASNSLEAYLGSANGQNANAAAAWQILELQVDAAGCHQLVLKDTNAPKVTTTIWLCLPQGALPFQVGDALSIKARTAGQSNGTLDGYEITSKSHRLRVGRGDQPVIYGSAPWSLTESSCGLVRGPCGAVGRTQVLSIQTGTSAPAASVAVGGKLALDATRTLWLTQAATLIAADSECVGFANSIGQRLETVLIQELTP